MANNLAKMALPAPVLEETTYPYLDQSLIEFVSVHACRTMVAPGRTAFSYAACSCRHRTGGSPLPKTKQFAARTPALMLDQHWGEIQGAYSASISARLGYVDDEQLLKTVADIRAGKTCALVRVLWTISLEFWLRDLAQRGLLDLPAFSELAPT